MQIRYLDGRRLRRALLAACEHAQRQRAELNRINVFPVPDGDTGTNLALTAKAIADHIRPAQDADVSRIAHQAAEGAVLGARGNCGMMLSHFLIGFAEGLGPQARVTTSEFAVAMSLGAERLQAALERPIEGTILTVIRDSAAAVHASTATDFVPLVADMVSAARRSLATTPDLLPVLKKAGVVDAGAKGFVALLEGADLLVRGEVVADVGVAVNDDSPGDVTRPEYPSAGEHFRFCTEALVRGRALPSQDAVRGVLRDVGDSLIVIRSGDVLKVHVHTDQPDQVFAYLRSVGTLVTHKAEDMHAQHAVVQKSGHVLLARRPVSVVTDSACDLPEEVVRAHGIHVAPMTLVEGDKTYRDGIDISATEFHERMRAQGALPTTSQPSPQALLDAYARAFEEGEVVVGVMVGSTLSGTMRSAEAAASRAPQLGQVHVVDSLGASLLQGLLVLKAVELAELGESPERIVNEVRRVRAQSGLLFTVETLDRLLASGRVSRGVALVGRMLDLRPILGLGPDGHVARFGRVRGGAKARSMLLGVVRSKIPVAARKLRFGIIHVGIANFADETAAELRATYGADVEVLTAPATPVIATHLGIGAWGVAYMVED